MDRVVHGDAEGDAGNEGRPHVEPDAAGAHQDIGGIDRGDIGDDAERRRQQGAPQNQHDDEYLQDSHPQTFQRAHDQQLLLVVEQSAKSGNVPLHCRHGLLFEV